MVLRITLLTASVLLTACANDTMLYNPQPQRMSTSDLNYFRYDCAHAEQQRAFLKTQLSYISPYEQNSVDRAIIHKIIHQMDTDCPRPTQLKPGCVHVREDMRSGSATATVCNDPRALGQRPIPVINHWDPLVDIN